MRVHASGMQTWVYINVYMCTSALIYDCVLGMFLHSGGFKGVSGVSIETPFGRQLTVVNEALSCKTRGAFHS